MLLVELTQYTQAFWILNFKWMDYVVYELYLNNTVEKQKQNEDIFQAKRCIGKKNFKNQTWNRNIFKNHITELCVGMKEEGMVLSLASYLFPFPFSGMICHLTMSALVCLVGIYSSSRAPGHQIATFTFGGNTPISNAYRNISFWACFKVCVRQVKKKKVVKHQASHRKQRQIGNPPQSQSTLYFL